MHACCIIGSVPEIRCFCLSWFVLSAMHSRNHELSGHVSILTEYFNPSHFNFTFMAWLCFQQSPDNLFHTTLASGTLSDIYSSTDAVVILSGILSGIHSKNLFWHSMWPSIWHSTRYIFWYSIISCNLSGILSGKYSDTLSCNLSGSLSGDSVWHSIWHSMWQIFWQSVWHSIWHISGILSGILSGSLSGNPSGGWGPAVLTALGPWQLRSSGAHCARTLAVEVQGCSLRSRAGEEDWR